MYNAHFGLDTEPFRVNPDPQFLFLSESHREALAVLVYAVSEKKGFIVQTGEVGTGKTTILNAMLGKLDARVKSAYLFNTALSVEDFFVYLFNELGIEQVEPFNKSRALHRLNEFLIDRLGRGLQTLLIVDEAQNLSTELLEEIRMLSNLETPRSKLLQIVLVGQPELAEKLARPELRQLRQRVELRHNIRPLTQEEVAGYVKERLLIAGHESGDVFSSSALRAVYRYSQGIPRIVNVLCDNALIVAFARQAVRVSAQMVREAAGDLDLAVSRGKNRTASPAGSTRSREGRSGFMRKLWSWRPEPELGV